MSATTWEAALSEWEKAATEKLAAKTLARYRAALRKFIEDCRKTAAVPAELTLELSERWCTSTANALERAAVRSFTRNLLPSQSAAPTPAEVEEAMSVTQVEPTYIGDDDTEELAGIEEPAAPVVEPTVAPQDVNQTASAAATALVNAELRKRLDKANTVKAEKKRIRDAEKSRQRDAAGLPPVIRAGSTEVRMPSNKRLTVHKRKDDGKRAYITNYTLDDFKGESSLEPFVAKYIVPKWGYGQYEVTVLGPNDEPVSSHPVTIDAPVSEHEHDANDPLHLVKEIISLSQNMAPGAQSKRAQLMSQLGLESDRPLTMRDLDRLQAIQAQPQGLDPLKIFELVEKLKPQPAPMPMHIPLPAPGPDPMMTMMIESMRAQSALLTTLMGSMFSNKSQGVDPLVAEMMKMERERNARLETRIDALQNQPPSRGLADAISELKEVQEIAKGVPGLESFSGEGGSLSSFLAKLLENAPAVGEAIGKVMERVATAKANGVRQAMSGQRVALPAAAAPAPLPLPEKAKIAIHQLAHGPQDDATITTAAIEALSSLGSDPAWQQKLAGYLESLKSGHNEEVAKLVVSLFRFANVEAHATPERVERIIETLRKMTEEPDEADAGDEEEHDGEELPAAVVPQPNGSAQTVQNA